MAEGTLSALGERLASLEVDTGGALNFFTTVVETCEQVAERSRKDYQELLVKHHALRQELDNLKASQTGQRVEAVSDPYFMVLIDGHSHRFLEQHLESGAKGGFAAVQALRKAVQQYMKVEMPALVKCRIVVRVFADLKGLCEEETVTLQLLTGFAAGCSSEDSFADLIDVRHRKVVNQKIEDSLKACMRDAQCQHVLLGARHAFHFMNVTEEPQNRDKVSYLKRDMLDDGIEKLRVESVAFPQVFRAFGQGNSAGNISSDIAAKIAASGACWDYQRDDCNRKNCIYRHIRVYAETIPTTTSRNTSDTSRRTSSSPTDLPKSAMENVIPVNAAGQRLDIYMSPPSQSQWDKYKARYKTKKLCNAHHLKGVCENPPGIVCEFDHRPIDKDLRHVLEFAAKHRPCDHNNNGSCRRLDCSKGHTCQRPECLALGKRAQGCIIAKDLHGIDYKLHMWVSPREGTEVTAGSGSKAIVAEVEDSVDGTNDGVSEGGAGYLPGYSNVAYDLIDLSE